MLEIWWIRHGETAWNRDGRIQGASDVPLSDHGRAQARALAARLDARTFAAVYASDLGRAAETARIALPGVEPLLDPRLRELSYGVLEGRRWDDDLPADVAADVRAWRRDPFGVRIPGGESFADLQARTRDFVADLDHAGRVAVFSHGGTIRSAIYAVTGRPADGEWHVEIDNASITRVRMGAGRVTIVALNDGAHLERGALDVAAPTVVAAAAP